MVINAYKLIEEDIIQKLQSKSRVVVGIDGMAASGKTSLARYLEDKYFARVIQMDDFFLQDHQRTEKRLKEIGGNIDYERFYQEVVLAVRNHQDINYHQYNCQTKEMKKETIKNDYHLLIIEGAYALREAFRDIYDLTYLILINSRTQIQRIKTRNEALYDRFINEWVPMENLYIDALDLKHVVNRFVIN